jgi:hypothetical protein
MKSAPHLMRIEVAGQWQDYYLAQTIRILIKYKVFT